MRLAKLGSKVATLTPRLQYQGQDKPWQKGPLSAPRKTGRAGVADRNRIKLRDRYTCKLCGIITSELQVDHIIPLSQGGEDTDSNKRCLCIPCHEAKSARESHART